jgi:hypothetical protein
MTMGRQPAQVTEAVMERKRALGVMPLGTDGPASARSLAAMPDRDEFDFCRQFIITVAPRTAEAEVHTAQPSWRSP